MQKPTLKNRAEQVLAQGQTGTNSKRWDQYVLGVYPTHLVRADKCNVWDSEGKTYIDFIGALGACVLGYNHPKVNEGVQEAIRNGLASMSFPTPYEVEVAEIISDMVPCAERMRFLKTGNEATLAAVRIARTYTKRSKVLSLGFHGHGDIWTSLSPPSLGVVDKFDIELLGEEVNGACVIIEPLGLTWDTDRVEYLIRLKARCAEQETLLIFDEIITGMRVPSYTISTLSGVDADIITLGKGLANGYPLTLVAGREEVMNCDEYFVSSTYSGEAISLAAAKATLIELRKKNMKDLFFYAERFMKKLNQLCEPIDVKIEGYGTRGMLTNVSCEKTALFMQECCKAGILFGKAFFYHFGHLESNIDEYVFNIISDVVNKIKVGGVKLEGKVPRETFIRA